jgi:hypothetical protein
VNTIAITTTTTTTTNNNKNTNANTNNNSIAPLLTPDGETPAYVLINLARLLARLVADIPYAEAIPLTTTEGQSMYYEAR